MRLYLVFLGLGFLFAIAGFLGLVGGIVGIILWAFAAVFFLLGFLAFVFRAKAKKRLPSEV